MRPARGARLRDGTGCTYDGSMRSLSRRALALLVFPWIALLSCSASESPGATYQTPGPDAGGADGTGGSGGTPSVDASPCPSNTKACGGECVGIDDPDYGCGDTGCFPCSIPGAYATCVAGACALDECLSNRADCNGDEADGCEVDLLTDARHCKGCGNECPGTPHGLPNCNQGGCSFLCDAGFALCATGCCPSISSTPGRLAAGRAHTCVTTAAGGVMCWGKAVANGATSDSAVALAVPGLDAGVTAIASKDAHTCALLQGGGVRCWGDNTFGALGNPSAGALSPTPVDVQGLTGPATAIAVGSGFACAKLASGGYACWGRNSDGQLGTGDKTDSSVAVAASKLVGLTFVAAGGAHACGIVGGGIQCWGNNASGQLGDGTKTSRVAPAFAFNLSSAGAYSIDAAGAHTCAVVGDGSVLCWGDNQYGQLGTGGAGGTQAYPQPVFDIAGKVALISTGYRHGCALLGSGVVQCWGEGSQGQIGDGDSIDRYTATNVTGLPQDVVTIASGELHSCALTADDRVYCWGGNGSGQVGDGSKIDRASPRLVQGL
jgi:alpha-tubulin suppressor-like RCC1 family protein